MLQVSSGAFTSKLVSLGQRLAGQLNPLVAEQNGNSGARLFPFAHAKVSPSLLASHLHASPAFDEIGYLMPNER